MPINLNVVYDRTRASTLPRSEQTSPVFPLEAATAPDPPLLSPNVGVARARLLEYLDLSHKYQMRAPQEHMGLLMRSRLYLQDRDAMLLICECR